MELLSLHEVALDRRIPRSKVWSLFETGQLKGIQIGGSGPVMFRKSDLEAIERPASPESLAAERTLNFRRTEAARKALAAKRANRAQ
jgi:hypothetical protein